MNIISTEQKHHVLSFFLCN